MWVEAVGVGVRVGLQLAMVWLVLQTWAENGVGRPTEPRRFLGAFGGGLGLTALVFALSFAVTLGPYERMRLSSVAGYVFFWVFLLGMAALFGADRTRLVQAARDWLEGNAFPDDVSLIGVDVR